MTGRRRKEFRNMAQINEFVYCEPSGNVYLDVVGHLQSPKGQAQLAAIGEIRKLIEKRNRLDQKS
jgi:hypothetical protein